MASCKFEDGKYHGGAEVKAHLRHNDISPERRAIAKKKNKDIDINRCKYNFNILGLTYKERCKKYDDRIKYLDNNGNTNIRKNRVTVQCIEIPVPAGLPRDRYHDWFFRIADILRAKYGEENFIDADIHYDEEHSYRDPETRELVESRVHGHYMIVPEVNGTLNCKEISLRKNMKALNREVETMTRDEFGCPFMTGTKKKSTKKVEELKQESENAELLYQIEQEHRVLNARRAALDAYEATLKSMAKELQEKEEKIFKTQNTLSEWQDNLEQRETTVRDLEEQKKTVQRELEAIRQKENTLDEAIRTVSEIPPMDSLAEEVLNRATIEVRSSPESPVTANFVAMKYLEHLRETQIQKARDIRKTVKRAAPEYTFYTQEPQEDMEF